MVNGFQSSVLFHCCFGFCLLDPYHPCLNVKRQKRKGGGCGTPRPAPGKFEKNDSFLVAVKLGNSTLLLDPLPLFPFVKIPKGNQAHTVISPPAHIIPLTVTFLPASFSISYPFVPFFITTVHSRCSATLTHDIHHSTRTQALVISLITAQVDNLEAFGIWILSTTYQTCLNIYRIYFT